MKKIFLALAFTLVALAGNNLYAQSFKFGYINSAELLQVLPDIEDVQKKMQAFAKDLELTLEDMQVEYNKKLDEWEKNQAKWSDDVKTQKMKDIQEVAGKVQEQRTEAEQRYNQESQKLMEPVFARVREAIRNVGKNNGFTYIFDTNAGSIPFVNEGQAINVMDLVKRELNITK